MIWIYMIYSLMNKKYMLNEWKCVISKCDLDWWFVVNDIKLLMIFN